uniref:glucuronosyltransferase n=1 Tax=Parastrongyloides trichosuri TaxID=131310 RepID=A0A0N5A5P3_PARTI
MLVKQMTRVCFFLSSIGFCFKILVYNPKFAYSHAKYLGSIADTLAEAGHDVTVLAPDIDLTIKYKGADKAKVITYPADPYAASFVTNNTQIDKMWDRGYAGIDQIDFLDALIESFYQQGLKVLHDEELRERIKSEKFDFGISEAFGAFSLGFFKTWGIQKYASVSTFCLLSLHYPVFGLSFQSSYLPVSMGWYEKEITLHDRMVNVLTNVGNIIHGQSKWEKYYMQKEFDKKYGVGYYDSKTLISDSAFYFINSNPFVDFPGPRMSKMIEIGGLTISEPKKLDKYWDGVLSKNKVNILISFGTFAQTNKMPKAKKMGLVNAIKMLSNYTFIWKYETPEDGEIEGVDNLILTEWMPQNDLLGDDRVSLIITHGGISTIMELATRGVPAISIPVFGDTIRNSRIVERHDIGLVMLKNKLEEPKVIVETIEKILNDKKYKENVVLLSKILNKRPFKPKELLVKNVELACEFGNLPMLNLRGRDMGIIEFYNIDVHLIIWTIILTGLYLNYTLLARIL